MGYDMKWLSCDRLLLDNGVDPNIRSEEWRGEGYEAARWTPLHYAISSGDAKIVTLLLDYHADIEAPITSDFVLELYVTFLSPSPSADTIVCLLMFFYIVDLG
jgi:hypothetical protein